MAIQPEVSVIIPVFNAEKYLAMSIESLLMQENLSMEVLIVDDHSTDRTKEIIETYAHKYPFIKLLTNERIKGGGGARNTAMACMTGETCFFLDGDDLVPPNALKPFIKFMKDNNAVLARGKLTHFCHQRWVFTQDPTFHDVQRDFYPSGSFAQYLYSSKFLKEKNLLFPEGFDAADDRSFFCEAFCHVDNIPFWEQDIYIYRINHKKIAYVCPKYVIDYVRHFTYVYNALEKYDKLNFYPSYLQSQFSYDCLRNAYYVVQEDWETTHTYLKLCAEIVRDQEELLAPNLNQWLKENAEAFWQACKSQDTKSMLKALQASNILVPHTTYVGIKEAQVQQHWFLLRCLHRFKNMVQYPRYFRKMLYIFRLAQNAKKTYVLK